MGSLERGVEILKYLAENGGQASLTKISQGTGIPSSSVHRLLSTLQSYCFVAQNNRLYELGFGLVPLAQSALTSLSDHSDIAPYLAELSDQWNEVGSACALVGHQVVCLQVSSVKDPHRAQFFVRPGQIMPLNGSASGKVVLAYQDPDNVRSVMSEIPLRAYTTKTITDPDVFIQHLQAVRDQGYALCEEELEIGVSAVAVPIRSISGKVNSCLTVVAPSSRLEEHLRDGLIDAMKNISGRMSLCSIAS